MCRKKPSHIYTVTSLSRKSCYTGIGLAALEAKKLMYTGGA